MKVVRSASRTGRLYPQECSWYSFSLGAESTSGPWYVQKEYATEKPMTPPGIDPGTVQLAQRLNHYTTPGPWLIINHLLLYVYTFVFQYFLSLSESEYETAAM